MMKKVFIFLPLYCVWVVTASYIAFGACTACTSPGTLEWIAIVGYLVVIMIPFWPFIKWLNAVPSWVKPIEANGKQAAATIVNVQNTGMVINNTMALVKLQLRVEPPDEAPFEVSQEKQISMITGLGRYSVGAHLKVKYDPDNKNHVVILSHPDTTLDNRARSGNAVAEASNSGSDVTQELAELSKLHKSGELSDSEFAAAKKKLLG
jgi:hypothetical protein